MAATFGSISTPILDQIQLTTLTAWENKINMATLARESAAWGMLKDRSMDEEGWDISVKSRIGRGNVGAHRGGSVINTQRRELFAGGRVEWKEYHATVTIDQRTLLQNCNMSVKDVAGMTSWTGMRSDSRAKLIDLLGSEMSATLEDFTDRLCKDLYANGRPAAGEPDILEGFGSIMEPNTPYAGVAHDEFPQFDRRGKLSRQQDHLWNPRFKDFKNRPARWNDYYLAGHDMHRGRRSGEVWVIMPSEHYDNMSLMLEGAKTRNKRASELGFEENIKALNFNMTFFPDDYCQGPDGNENVVYGFQPDYLQMLIHKGDNMTFHPGVIPDDQFTIVFRITMMLAIVCRDRSRTFKFFNALP